MRKLVLLIFMLVFFTNVKSQEVKLSEDSTILSLIHDVNKLYLYDLFEVYKKPDYFENAEFVMDKDRLYRRNVLLRSFLIDTLLDIDDRILAKKVLDLHNLNLALLDLDKSIKDSLYGNMYDSVNAQGYILELEKLINVEFNSTNTFIASAIKDIKEYKIASSGLHEHLNKLEKLLAKLTFDDQMVDQFKKLKPKFNAKSKYIYLNDVIDDCINNKKVSKKVFITNFDEQSDIKNNN